MHNYSFAISLAFLAGIALGQAADDKPECEKCSADDRERICLRTTDGKTMELCDALVAYTNSIRDAEKQQGCKEHLAELYKLRGLVWQIKNERQMEAKARADAAKAKNATEKADRVAREEKGPDKAKQPKKWIMVAKLIQPLHLFNSGTHRVHTQPTEEDLGTLIDMDVKDFTESLRLNPVQADVYAYRGLSWLAKTKDQPADNPYYSETLDDFERALRICDKYTCAYFWRAGLRLRQQDASWKEWNAKKAETQKKADDKAKKEADDKDKKNKADDKGKKEKADDQPKKKIEKAEAAPPAKEFTCEQAKAAVKKAQGAVKKAQGTVAKKKKELDQSNLDFTYATTVLEAAKTRWTTAKQELASANQAYFPVAKDIFYAAAKELDERKTKWERARETLVAATKAVDDANKNLGTPQKAQAKVAADRSALEEMKSELKRAIADYSDVLRLAPADLQAVGCRNEATGLLKKVEDMLKCMKSTDDGGN